MAPMGSHRKSAKRESRLCQAFAAIVFLGGCLFVFLTNGPRLLTRERGTPEVEPKPGHMPNWVRGHMKLAGEMEQACQRQHAYDLLWYGDSITESFREEVRGGPCTQRCDGIAAVWDSFFGPGSGYRAAAFGSSGDTTEHLLWRLMHGESPSCPGARIAGTNDLGIAAYGADTTGAAAAAAVKAAVPGAAEGAKQVALLLRKLLPKAEILMLGLLPRGLKDKSINPESPVIYHGLPSMYSEPIRKINLQLESFAETQKQMRYLDCGAPFVNAEGSLDPDLMPDALHPNAEGMRLLAGCVKEAVRSIHNS